MPLAVLALFLLTLNAGFGQETPASKAGKRYALVVGNGAYQKIAPVPAALKDVEAISAALKRADFDVTVVTNMVMPEFALKTEQEFLKKPQQGDICFFYYSGHSASAPEAEINFLLPVNFDPRSAESVMGRAYPLVRLQQELKKRNVGLKIFIIEGPQELPVPIVGANTSLLNPQLGESPETLFAFAAQPDRTVLPTSNPIGLFTQFLVEQIDKPGPRVREVFDNAKQNVGQKTSEQQIPFVNDNIVNYASFRFHEPPPPPPTKKEITGVPFQNKKDREEYVLIPAGKFKMGCVPNSPKCEGNESPQHEVTIGKDFWMGRNEVQVSSYDHYVKLSDKQAKMPRAPLENKGWRSTNFPMNNLTWEEAGAYCKWAGGRLPTEAEWEYAARAGAENQVFPMTGEDSRDKANFAGKKGNDTFEDLAPVKSFDPNKFGLFDMAGNVWEWVSDFYSSNYYAASPAKDPKGPDSGKEHIVRGGSFDSDPKEHLRISFRKATNKASDNIGMRCVLDDTPETRKLLNAP